MWKWSFLKRLLSKRAEISNLGAVMWPVYFEGVPDAHVTVVIFDDINNPNIGFTKEDVISAVEELEHCQYLWLSVDGLEYFGPDKDVPVLRVSHSYLHIFREQLISILTERGIPINENYPEYKPHVTIPEGMSEYPEKLLASPVEVWWGGEHYSVPCKYSGK